MNRCMRAMFAATVGSVMLLGSGCESPPTQQDVEHTLAREVYSHQRRQCERQLDATTYLDCVRQTRELSDQWRVTQEKKRKP